MCGPRWHFPSSARGFRWRRLGSAAFVSAHRLRMVLGATLAAGHLWHMLIQQGGEKAPNTAADYPNICLPCPSPARSPGSEQFKGLIAFSGRAGGILEATGDAAERLLGPGAWSTAHCMASSSLWTRELTPGRVRQSGILLSPFLGPFPLAHPISCLLSPFLAPSLWPIQRATASF